MQSFVPILRHLTAGLLAAVLLVPVGMQLMHQLEDAREVAHHCDATPNQTHVHDPEVLNFHFCALCSLHYSFFTVEKSAVHDTPAAALAGEQPATPVRLYYRTERRTCQLRGPPVV